MIKGSDLQADGARDHRVGLLAVMAVSVILLCPPVQAESGVSIENVPPPESETISNEPAADPAAPAEATTENDAEAQTTDPALPPAIHVSGSVWRSKPGIVFLQTPIGLLSLSSRTGLRDVKNSHKITLSVNGANTAVDIRDRTTGSLVHRYLSGIPRYPSSDNQTVQLWTPEGDRTFSVGTFGAKMSRDPARAVTLEVDGAGAVKGLHAIQFDLQVSQAPRSDSQTRMRLRGTVTKLKSAFIFLKTSLGMVTVGAKTGVRNAKVGQDMTVWIHGDHVAIDLYQGNEPAPLRRFLSGRLEYATPDKTSVMLWTPEGDKTFRPDPRGKSSLAAMKEGAPITVELDQHGEIVEIRRLN
ncbi:MAG TPA: hypothetical protein VJ805_05910 [Nitrospiraceae bacterium]|nr:hypothetical protein [Nitrospiraceae bacterium]